MDIGSKIRTERLKKNMTQNVLCEDKITRNMLSAIECGKAMPSLDTLSYLAERLNVPISYLVSDEVDSLVLKKMERISAIKLAYREQRFQDCIKLISDVEAPDDELSLILAYSYFNVGKQSLRSGTLLSAQKQLELCKRHCDMTIYDTSRIEAVLPIYVAVAKNIQSPLLELDVKAIESNEYFISDFEFYKYISLDTKYAYRTHLFERHTAARILIRERDYYSALEILKKLEEEKNSENYNAYVFFAIYSDMESCYKQLADFENAYRYSSKRLSMLEGFKT